ncbi:synaptotagmin-like protein 5 isoform X4 [Salminus brasiliensis]|uniref:synaptotagmin-like protein 5 isoform X4 n=1 Tax=Salminus brasiliensis TaxID=930266 RepID=UPI003B837415
MAKTTEVLNLSFLLEHEREMILSVLQKDEKLRKREEKRIRKLKNELLELKRSTRRSNPEHRECGVCLRALGLILQRGSVCDDCQRRVCSFCMAVSPNSSHSKCTVCAKTAELKVVTGEWFLEERAKRYDRVTVPCSDVIQQLILNSPPEKLKISPLGVDQSATPQHEQSATPQSEKNMGRNIGRKKVVKALAVESSGLPTTPNNLRAQPERLSTQAEGRKRIAVVLRLTSVIQGRSLIMILCPVAATQFLDLMMQVQMRTLMPCCLPTAKPTAVSAVLSLCLNSIMSVYSETGDYGNAHVSGEILLNISYSYKTGALNILVRECRCLATGDERKQRTDPYVKTYLLPDKSRQSKRKTSMKSNTNNPVFNENLRYIVSHSQLETRTLQVSVWHHDRFGHNSFLGETELTFDSWEFDTQIEEWFALQPRAECSADSMIQYKGELTVVLRYIPAEKNLSLPLDQVQVKKGFLKGKKSITLPKGGMVELLVKEAKNLTAVKSGSSDSFVKGYLLPDDKKSTKHKTAVVRRSVNPRWNHTFTYCGLQHTDLDSVCLELTVWDKEPLASNVFLGGVRLGAGTGLSYGKEVDWNDAYGEEQRLWQRMVDNPEVPQECTLMLRSSMAKRKA